MDARLIIDAPATGPWNMAVDDVLFRDLMPGKVASIRIYRWSEPTVSLGYFQPAADRGMHSPSLNLRWLRRPTGGGAIVHDGELTYSLALPLVDDRPAAARGILVAVHESLAGLLREFQIPVRRWANASPNSAAAEPFLCFLRRAMDDLFLGENKVVGSAQRRRRHGLLQHGSILLRRSPSAPELPGIEDITHTAGLMEQLLESWPARLAQTLQLRIARSALTARECQHARQCAQARFEADCWNQKR